MRSTPYPPPRTTAPAQQTVPPIPRVSKGRVLRRGFQRFALAIRNGLRVIFAGRPIIMLCLILFGGFAAWMAYDRFFAASSSSPHGPSTIVQLPEASVVQSYLSATQKGDADAIWNTLSATEKARRVAGSEDKTVLSQILQYEQQSKMAYTAFHYVGSYQEGGTDGPALFFYVGDVGNGSQKRQLPLLFAVGKNGMIVEAQDSLYSAVLAQLKSGP